MLSCGCLSRVWRPQNVRNAMLPVAPGTAAHREVQELLAPHSALPGPSGMPSDLTWVTGQQALSIYFSDPEVGQTYTSRVSKLLERDKVCREGGPEEAHGTVWRDVSLHLAFSSWRNARFLLVWAVMAA